MRWVKVSDGECRVVFEHSEPQGAMAALGFRAQHLPGKVKSTSQWMRELREAEKP